ncbi:MAG: hypothetical protein LBM25_03030 [Bacteroidales bacterium]|jgi:hypothetical protein|nr:hypothetical protein [Bacteroidales bacterium]
MIGQKKYLILILTTLLLNYFSLYAQNSDRNIPFKSYYEGSLKNNGRLTISFSTINMEDIVFSSSISSIGSKNIYNLKLQYSFDKKNWIDVKDNSGRIFFNSAKRAKSRQFSIFLPLECENKDSVFLSWKSTRQRGKGKYPNLNIKNIDIVASYDRFKGEDAIIEVAKKNLKDTTYDVEELVFNHIAMPYSFAEGKKIIVKGVNIREEGIDISLKGKDDRYFKINLSNIKIDSCGEEVLEVSYNPLKTGSHNCNLILSTKKLKKPIVINLYGSCDNMIDINENLIVGNVDKLNDFTKFRLPVFSQTKYQFKISLTKEELLKNNLSITYKWFRDDVSLDEDMKYETNSLNINSKDITINGEDIEYIKDVFAPQKANYLQIEFDSKNPNFEIKDISFGYPSPKKTIRSGNWSNPNIWSPKGVPNIEDIVMISEKNKIVIDNSASCSMLILSDSANIIIPSGNMLQISGNIVYSHGSFFVVHKDIKAKKWNYLSSPINDAKALVYSMRKQENETWLMKYNTGKISNLNDYWSEYIVDPNYKLIPAKGYAVYSNNNLDVIYEGILSDSRVNYSLEFTPKDKWNLIGNPFTAPLSSKKLFEDIDNKIYGNAIFIWDKENEVYNPMIIDYKTEFAISPQEAFFVESIKEGLEISFQRKHQFIPENNVVDNSFANTNYIKFTISNKEKSQYILMGKNKNSKQGFDNYDAHKLFGSSEKTPDAYFIVDNEELSINSVKDFSQKTSLGYFIGEDAILTLYIDNLSSLDEQEIILIRDKYQDVYYNICEKNSINFLSKKGETEDRFDIFILNSLERSFSNENSYLYSTYIWSEDGDIMFFDNKEKTTIKKIRLWNQNGIEMINQEYEGGMQKLNMKFSRGSYTVDILTTDNTWIEDIPCYVK